MALKTNVGEVFNNILAKAGGKQQKEDKPFWREADDGKDDSDDDDDEPKDKKKESGPQSFAEKVRQSRIDGSLSGNKQDDDDEEEEVVVKKKKKKVKKAVEEDSSTDDDLDFRVPKKKKKDEVKKEEDENKEEKPDDKKEDKKEVKEEDDKKEDDEEELTDEQKEENKVLEDAMGVDPSSMTRKDGQPLGEQASKVIKRLKGVIKYFAEKAKKLEHKEYDPELPNKYKQLNDGFTNLKKKWDTRFFQETPEWKQKFEKPLEDASMEASKWIRSHDHSDDSEEIQELENHRMGMQRALKDKDDVKFYEHSDSIAELLKKGAGSRFQSAVPKMWDAYWARQDALKDADSAAKSVTEETENFVSSKVKEATTNLSVMIDNFEQSNAKIIHLYKTKPGVSEEVDYENTVTKRLDDTKKLIEQSIRNRSMPAELQKIIFQGVLYGLKEKELAGMREYIKQERGTISRLEKQLEKQDKGLKALKPSRSVIIDDEDDDEEEDDGADSFHAFFKKKIGR